MSLLEGVYSAVLHVVLKMCINGITGAFSCMSAFLKHYCLNVSMLCMYAILHVILSPYTVPSYKHPAVPCIPFS